MPPNLSTSCLSSPPLPTIAYTACPRVLFPAPGRWAQLPTTKADFLHKCLPAAGCCFSALLQELPWFHRSRALPSSWISHLWVASLLGFMPMTMSIWRADVVWEIFQISREGKVTIYFFLRKAIKFQGGKISLNVWSRSSFSQTHLMYGK